MVVEYLDIVDENDVVIGRDTRKNVHDNYEIHRGVHVLVVDQLGRILVQRRSMNKDYYPGCLDMSVGAQVTSGETYEQAASRELMEELGCHSGPLTRVADYDAYSARQREKRRIFIHYCEGPFTPDPAEIDSLTFVAIDDLHKMLESESFTEGFRRSLAIYLDTRGDAI
jgi:isopentenyl-diphosphate delta-isomerase